MDKYSLLLIIPATSVILLVARECYLWFKFNFPASVQCWFCHKKSKVRYDQVNSWLCPGCEQYNGFTQDGGYNKILPQQYDESLNSCITSIGRRKEDWYRENTLCSSCNRNQELKIKQLASFVPINENNYDEEIEHYKKQLEKSYKLCKRCEHLVTKVVPSPATTNNTGSARRLQVTSGVHVYNLKTFITLLLISGGLSIHALKPLTYFPKWALSFWSLAQEAVSQEIERQYLSHFSPFIPEWTQNLVDEYIVKSSNHLLMICGIGFVLQLYFVVRNRSLWFWITFGFWIVLGISIVIEHPLKLTFQATCGISIFISNLLGTLCKTSSTRQLKSPQASPLKSELKSESALPAFQPKTFVNSVPQNTSVFKPVPKKTRESTDPLNLTGSRLKSLNLGQDQFERVKTRSHVDNPFCNPVTRGSTSQRSTNSPLISPPKLNVSHRSNESWNPLKLSNSTFSSLRSPSVEQIDSLSELGASFTTSVPFYSYSPKHQSFVTYRYPYNSNLSASIYGFNSSNIHSFANETYTKILPSCSTPVQNSLPNESKPTVVFGQSFVSNLQFVLTLVVALSNVCVIYAMYNSGLLNKS